MKLIRCQKCGGKAVEVVTDGVGILGTHCDTCSFVVAGDNWNREQQSIRAKKKFELVKAGMSRLNTEELSVILSDAEDILRVLYGEVPE